MEKYREIENVNSKREKKRIVLSEQSKLKERVGQLQEVIGELKAKYPEIVGLTLFGSLTMGHARESSDIDGDIIIDLDTPGVISKKKINILDFKNTILKEIAEHLKLEEYQVEHIGTSVYSEELIRKNCELDPIYLAPLFRFSLGSGINKLRAMVLNELEKMEESGDGGEKAWRKIVQYLWERDNYRLGRPGLADERKKLYPWTLEKARAYYLK